MPTTPRTRTCRSQLSSFFTWTFAFWRQRATGKAIRDSQRDESTQLRRAEYPGCTRHWRKRNSGNRAPNISRKKILSLKGAGWPESVGANHWANTSRKEPPSSQAKP